MIYADDERRRQFSLSRRTGYYDKLKLVYDEIIANDGLSLAIQFAWAVIYYLEKDGTL